MEISLVLKSHCIQTTARAAHEAAMREYFKAPAPRQAELEDRIEALASFLESVDFSDLRGRHPALAGDNDPPVTVVVTATDDGFDVHVQGETVAALVR